MSAKDRWVYEETGCVICGDPIPLPWWTGEPNLCFECQQYTPDSVNEVPFEEYLKKKGIILDIKPEDFDEIEPC